AAELTAVGTGALATHAVRPGGAGIVASAAVGVARGGVDAVLTAQRRRAGAHTVRADTRLRCCTRFAAGAAVGRAGRRVDAARAAERQALRAASCNRLAQALIAEILRTARGPAGTAMSRIGSNGGASRAAQRFPRWTRASAVRTEA